MDKLFNERTDDNQGNNKNEQTQESFLKACLAKGKESFFVHRDSSLSAGQYLCSLVNQVASRGQGLKERSRESNC